MSLKLHDSTNIGIEIEICMKKDFYKSLQSKKKILHKYINILKAKTHLGKITPIILISSQN